MTGNCPALKPWSRMARTSQKESNSQMAFSTLKRSITTRLQSQRESMKTPFSQDYVDEGLFFESNRTIRDAFVKRSPSIKAHFPRKGRLPRFQVVERARPAIANADMLAHANKAHTRFSFFFRPRYTVILLPERTMDHSGGIFPVAFSGRIAILRCFCASRKPPLPQTSAIFPKRMKKHRFEHNSSD